MNHETPRYEERLMNAAGDLLDVAKRFIQLYNDAGPVSAVGDLYRQARHVIALVEPDEEHAHE
jgi:hypothetical protein